MSAENTATGPRQWIGMLVLAISVLGLLAVLALTLGAPVHILQDAMCSGAKCGAGGLGPFIKLANSLDTPVSAAIGSVSILGVLAGGAMLGIAHPSATKVLFMSAGAGLVVVLAQGVIH